MNSTTNDGASKMTTTKIEAGRYHIAAGNVSGIAHQRTRTVKALGWTKGEWNFNGRAKCVGLGGHGVDFTAATLADVKAQIAAAVR
jgi:hypothetical protein